MIYTAPDGHVIQSNPIAPVEYACAFSGGIVGTFESFETKAANNVYGIEQIKIVREISENSITITITESTEQELQDYINSVDRNVITVDQLINE
jgi:hypothetical protein